MVKFSPEVITWDFPGETVLFDLRTNVPYLLNSTAVLIWKGLEQGEDEDRIANSLQEEFRINKKRARSDIARFKKFLQRKGIIQQDATCEVKLKGYSMHPFLPEGTILRIKEISIEKLAVGDVIMFKRQGARIVHRLLKKEQGKEGEEFLVTRGDGNLSSEVVKLEEFVGKVVGVSLDGECFLSPGSFRWRMMVILHKILSPFGDKNWKKKVKGMRRRIFELLAYPERIR
ncbi:MAG: signal peptidase I [Caldiserica bacterium]|nr:signal peptidase I [Caldisericota bacterium]